MPINLELKVKVDSHKSFEKILKSIDAEFIDTLKQKDVYFKSKIGLLKLRIEGEKHTLIKYQRNEKGKRFSNYELLEVDGKNPLKYLSTIFSKEVIVDKKRKLYLYDNTRIHLDEITNLGKFIELETMVITNKKEAISRFNFIKHILGLGKLKEIKTSYRVLYKNK